MHDVKYLNGAGQHDTWTAFTRLPDATNIDGTLNLTGTDMGGGVWVTKQTTANSATWTPWTRVGTTPNTLLHVATETNADGRFAIVGVGPNGAIWQTHPNRTQRHHLHPAVLLPVSLHQQRRSLAKGPRARPSAERRSPMHARDAS